MFTALVDGVNLEYQTTYTLRAECVCVCVRIISLHYLFLLLMLTKLSPLCSVFSVVSVLAQGLHIRVRGQGLGAVGVRVLYSRFLLACSLYTQSFPLPTLDFPSAFEGVFPMGSSAHWDRPSQFLVSEGSSCDS